MQWHQVICLLLKHNDSMRNTDIIGRVWRGNLIDSRPFDDVRYENPRYAVILQCRDNHDCNVQQDSDDCVSLLTV